MQLARKAVHASLTLSSRHPGSSLQVPARKIAGRTLEAAGIDGGVCAEGAGLGAASGNAPDRGAAGAAGAGACVVLQLAPTKIMRHAQKADPNPWSFSARCFMMAASINVPSAVSMDLLWLLMEAGVALALLLGIVWWTWPRRRERDASADQKPKS